ncbi:hypothetical protein NECAME_00881 [Necator americanus]|uniref:Uncharacterized protein n=1 Tax=Necator americanus TaxID=51031 RepID=W2SR67_NECAM|nr:hypothetical protein NECAME_00881 [Necator americanus]ETN71192.1 hypothetical protein NECAME_00881 [Necator americanus]
MPAQPFPTRRLQMISGNSNTLEIGHNRRISQINNQQEKKQLSTAVEHSLTLQLIRNAICSWAARE